jgi:hypothetical protein
MAHFAHAMAHARNVLLRGCHRTAPCPASGARCRGAHCHWLPARPGAACTSPVPRTPLRSPQAPWQAPWLRRSARHSTGVLSCGCCVLNNVAISNNGTTTRHRSRSQKTKTKNKKLVRYPPPECRDTRETNKYIMHMTYAAKAKVGPMAPDRRYTLYSFTATTALHSLVPTLPLRREVHGLRCSLVCLCEFDVLADGADWRCR